jgi:hypothetical protein
MGISETFTDAGHEDPVENIKHSLGGGSTRDTLQAIFDPGNILGFGGESKKSKQARRARKRLDQQHAAITRDQWEHFKEFYRPIEQAALEKAQQTDFTTEGDEAGATARAGVTSSRGTLARSLSRVGATLTAEEKSAVERRHRSSLTKSVARAENTTRRGLSDSRTNLLASLVGIGRGVANTATRGLNTANDLAAAREMEINRQEAANQASRTQTGATILGGILALV